MSINYIRGIITIQTPGGFDATLYDASLNGDQLISRVNKIDNVTPVTVANVFSYSCIVQGVGVAWINQGTPALPVWAVISTGSSGGGSVPTEVTPAGAVDGINTVFTLPIALLPSTTALFQLFADGQLKKEGVTPTDEYSFAIILGIPTITFNTAPLVGTVLQAFIYPI